MLKSIKKGWLLIMMIVASMTISTTTTTAQSGFSTNYGYSTSWGENNTYVGNYYNAWGRYCEKWKRMVWTQHQGYHEVRYWNNQTGTWYTQWRSGYYWTYYWYFYDKCY